MNRRNLFGCVAGAFAFLLGSRKAKAGSLEVNIPLRLKKLPSYIYDWQGSYTDDPMCRPLGYKDESPLIFCDNRLVVSPDVSFCQSGEQGYYILCELEEGRLVNTKHCGRIIVRQHPHHSEIVEAT